ncbi:hypothetical protein EV174_006535, partial [Coemansia sp. RSA 2320]
MTLPRWYAESRFLLAESTRATADTTDYLVFGRLFRTPTNREHRDANHMHISFCHLEDPRDCCGGGALADPPADIAATVRQLYAPPATPRCTVDCTFKDPRLVARLLRAFERAGYACERGIQDQVMCLDLSAAALAWRATSSRVARVLPEACDAELAALLAACNARCFGYSGCGGWVAEKLRRQVRLPSEFRVYALRIGARVAAFAVVYTPWEKARHLALVQVLGTDPRDRRQGLATEVLAHALAQLPASCERVYLDAVKDSFAVELYRRLEFEPVGLV